MNKKKILSLMSATNIIIVVVLINIFLSFYPFLKIDLSKEKIHSLSPTTKNIVKGLDDIVTIKVFASEDLPTNLKPMASNLKTILEEFSRLNRNRFKVQYFDPAKNLSAKDEADKLGIQKLQFSSLKSDKYEVSTGYFGLAIFYGSKKVILPVAGDVDNMEYFIDSGVKRILRKETPEIALYEDNKDSQTQLQYLRKFLSADYTVDEVQQINGEQKLPEKADLLVIVGQKNKLDNAGLTKLKDWVNNKKGLIAFIDKVSLNQSLQGTVNADSGLESIFKEKGMDVQTNLVVDESSTYANFQSQNGQFAVQYPLWVQIRPENINKNVPAVSGVNELIMPWTSSINISNGAKELFSSSQNSLTINDFSSLLPTMQFPKQYTGKKTIGAINTDGVKMALIGNSNFIKDQYVTGSSQNLYLALNMVDYFSQDASLLSIRSKSLDSNPLKNISDNSKSIIRWTMVFLPVILLILTAVAANIIRKKNNRIWSLYEN